MIKLALSKLPQLIAAVCIFMLVSLTLKLMPTAIGHLLSKEALNAAAAAESAQADLSIAKRPLLLPNTPTTCTLNGTLGTAPAGGATGTLALRLFRGGTPTSCASAPYPGTTGTGPYLYNVHYITNNSGSAACTNVVLHYVSGGTATVNIQVAAFLAPFSASDFSNSARYLGDPGLSSGNPPADITFPVNVPAGATIALVVFNANPSPAGQDTMYQLQLDQDIFCAPAAAVSLTSATLSSENCSPGNGVVDPGETVTVDVKLTNSGTASTTNLVATLQTSGGVINPSGPQTYGMIAPGGMVTKTFTFTADSMAACGGNIVASFQLSDNGNNLGTATSNFPTGTITTLSTHNFDGVTPPSLPANWTADQGTNGAASPLWETSSSGVPTPVADSTPNAVYTQDPASLLDNRLYSPVITYPTNARLSFRQNYDLEQQSATVAYDAAVLEMNVNNGGWQDILTAGGTFVTGGYNHTNLNTGFSNPLLPDRPSWSGISNGGTGGFETCVVSLPAAAVNQPVQFRWRMGSDTSVSHAGWRVDNVSLVLPVCCSSTAPTVASAVSRKVHGSNTFDVNLPTTGPAGIEPRLGGATNDYTMVVTFGATVSIMGTPQAQVISGSATIGSNGASNGGAVSVSGNVVTIPLTSVTSQQTIQVRLNSVNGTSNVTIPMSILVGDVNGDGFTNAADITIARNRSGLPIDASNFRADFNTDGNLNSADVTIVRARSGQSLP